jgi:5'-nucleotidase
VGEAGQGQVRESAEQGEGGEEQGKVESARRQGEATLSGLPMHQSRSLVLVSALLLGLVRIVPAHAQDARAPVDLTIIAINDFHGNLKPPPGGIAIADPADRSRKLRIAAGGAERIATLVKQLRAGAANSVFVAAGDLIGATPLLSAMFADEPTIESLSEMGLEISAVGNHEFDKGRFELLRMQNGGCHPAKGCFGPQPFAGAKFRYLAASTVVASTGQTLFPPYAVKTFGGVPVAFIGLTLKGTPAIISPSAAAGLRFADEAETVNALVPQLRARGIEAIVVLIHEGGYPTGDFNECPGISGAIVDIVKKLDKAVDLVVSGHTHRAYNCVIDGRLVTSAESFGRLVTRIDVKLDPKTRDVIGAKAENLVVRTDALAPDRAQTELIASYEARVTSLAGRVVGSITATLSRAPGPNGESVLGDIVADAQLAATRAEQDGGAQLAFTNPGGVRTDIVRRDDGNVTYADVFASQPFNNSLVTLTLTGAQIKELLERQWLGQQNPRILHPSRNFAYTWDAARPPGERVDAATIRLDGQPIDLGSRYRVTVNNFLAEGGDGFVVLREGTERSTGGGDLAALVAWFEANSPIAPGPLDRIRRVN